MTVKRIFQKEPVLSIATCLALISAFIVHPDTEYFSYIDFRTLAILFSLMTVMAGLRGQGVFDKLGHTLLSHTRTTLQLTTVLVGLCFFSSMLITNDVSLLTFVPFTFVVLNSLDASVRSKLLLPIVCILAEKEKPLCSRQRFIVIFCFQNSQANNADAATIKALPASDSSIGAANGHNSNATSAEAAACA